MISCLASEVVQRKDYLSEDEVTTLYFGGGTPSLLDIDHLSEITNAVKNNFKLANNCEFTMETNPDDINPEQLESWLKLGVNRLSIGTQSFREKDLDWMNRAHTNEESIQSIQLAKDAGFKNVSIDLIYGLPEQSLEDWKDQLQQAIELDVQHLSCYCLTVEERTALKKWVEIGKLVIPDDDVQSMQFRLMKDMFEAVGFEHYEISNFAKPGFASQHNSSYWQGEKYLGIGPSAHSFDGVKRRWNVANNQKYMKLLSTGDYFEEETLSQTDKFNELILTGLRTVRGVDLVELQGIMEIPASVSEQIQEAEKRGWVEVSGNCIKLTGQGWLMADHISSAFFIV